jgi:hypothetical protein
MSVTCPKCGEIIETRAKIGSGTQRAKNLKFLNENKMNVLRCLISTNPAPQTVRDIQKQLTWTNTPRKSGKRMSGWNYHLTQADLSVLVGKGLVKMSKPEESYDPKTAEHHARPVPKYSIVCITQTQLVLNRGGDLREEAKA